MPLRSPLYSYNQLLVSCYTNGRDTKYKFVYFPKLRNSGLETDDYFLPFDVADDFKKLDNNLCRARSVIYELAFCNRWDWFFTGTLDERKQNRADLDGFRKDFGYFVRNKNKQGSNIKYLLVPELHADLENWHFHGFLSGVPASDLRQFQAGDTMSSYIAKKVLSGQMVCSWKSYEKRFGFCDLEQIQSHDGACKYVTKYISKSLEHSVQAKNKHIFAASQGLNRRENVYHDSISVQLMDFMNSQSSCHHGEYSVSCWISADEFENIRDLLGAK